MLLSGLDYFDWYLRSFILDVLQKRPTTPTLKHYTIDHLRFTTGSFDYTLKVMTELEKQVNRLPIPFELRADH